MPPLLSSNRITGFSCSLSFPPIPLRLCPYHTISAASRPNVSAGAFVGRGAMKPGAALGIRELSAMGANINTATCMPLPRSSGNKRHSAMQGLRRGVVVGLWSVAGSRHLPPSLDSGSAIGEEGSMCAKRRLGGARLSVISTLCNVCQGWHI